MPVPLGSIHNHHLTRTVFVYWWLTKDANTIMCTTSIDTDQLYT